MASLLLLIALLTLLAAPGPTNALRLAAGATNGQIKLRFAFAATAGCLVTVLAMVTLVSLGPRRPS